MVCKSPHGMYNNDEHEWEGCQCKNCGKQRSKAHESHEWRGCKCAVCGIVDSGKEQGHEWRDCRCGVCGRIREKTHESHRWEGCKCLVCKSTRDGEHDWSADCEKCARCSAKRSDAHQWQGVWCVACRKLMETCERCRQHSPHLVTVLGTVGEGVLGRRDLCKECVAHVAITGVIDHTDSRPTLQF